MIEIKGLTKNYKTKKKRSYRILKDVDLALPPRGMVFLLGKSGSGKSTFLNLLGGLRHCLLQDEQLTKHPIFHF